MSAPVAPERYTLVDGPQKGRVMENTHPVLVFWPNENIRLRRLDAGRPRTDVYRLQADGTATWVE